MATLMNDFLAALGVKHTAAYSARRYGEMPFQSMFGISELLKEYGVATVGVQVDRGVMPAVLPQMPLPFLADTPDGFMIVTSVTDSQVTYISQGNNFTATIDELINGWNGIALLATADDEAIEPEYTRHRVAELSMGVKKWLLIAIALVLIGIGMWISGLYVQPMAWVVAALDSGGIILSWMLVQKSLGIHTRAADRVCGAIEEGGCDEIASSGASSFFGIFKWSEVGIAYFSVSLLAMLLVPGSMSALAAINILCLPYTIWSISYQRFVAKAWCTLCVMVQITLWLLAVSYLIGGWIKHIFPLTPHFFTTFIILACCYVGSLLGINSLDNAIGNLINRNKNENA